MKKLIYYIFILLLSITAIILAFNSTIIPNIILYLIILFYTINLVLILLLIIRKKKIFRIIGIILSILILIISLGIGYIYYRSNNFFNKITNVEYEKSNYSVIVLKDSSYEKLEDLSNIGIYYNEIDKHYIEALDELNNKATIYNNNYDNILLLISDFINGNNQSILINENYIEIINETESKFKDNIRIIDTITISSQKEKTLEGIDITKLENFNIYISGIDTYGEISNVSRSDVNMLATINIKDNKILLTNTPRDYYVQIAGTTGTKDKLTHAGVYGINTSIKTIENLYDTKINYYVRVNFNSVIKLVDKIGGIDVYSDMEFGSGKYHVNYGWNHFDGEQALNYSRQRKIYLEGDRHRGQNQQQVIEAIIKKVTESNDINYYVSILEAIENNFQTNMDKKLINGFINLQVKNNYNWSVESIQVTGYDSANYTYSYPGQLLYVMEPDYNSLETAKNKIKEVLKNE